MGNVKRKVVKTNEFDRKDLIGIRTYMLEVVMRIDRIMNDAGVVDCEKKEELLDGICAYYKTTREDLKKAWRTTRLVNRRRIACKILRDHTKLTTTEIAQELGYKNHATVLHHLRGTESMLSKELYGNKELRDKYHELLTFLNLMDNENKTVNQEQKAGE